MRITFWFNKSIFSSAFVERSSGLGGDFGFNSIPPPRPPAEERAREGTEAGKGAACWRYSEAL